MTDELDVKEIFSLVDNASGQFALAHETFEQIAALFKSIAASLPEHTTGHRLAKLGEDLCEDRADTFEGTRDEYSQHTERYLPYFYGAAGCALVTCKSRRASTAEDSSKADR